MESAAPYSILVADDDDEDRELFDEIFSHDERFSVLGIVESGVEVLDEVSRQKHVPDILLVDMYMPYFTGVEIVKALEELHVAPTTYKFIISTTNNIAENEPVLHSPYIVFLKKPASREEIHALPGLIVQHMQQRVAKLS
jgi:CheY-like chemotaxis protein